VIHVTKASFDTETIAEIAAMCRLVKKRCAPSCWRIQLAVRRNLRFFCSRAGLTK